ncbi:unnamed protein product [Ranitomeya imitator]|uniref:GPN-loop GTPase 3 n=1 Tax=Ranitomeya imitator TaxID=111125 RepID=A0ABN9KTX5_9NEOB|nr:unnamed protein product [Ranitomeya imitator]
MTLSGSRRVTVQNSVAVIVTVQMPIPDIHTALYIRYTYTLDGGPILTYQHMDTDDSRIRGRLCPLLIGRGNLYDIIVAMATIMTSTSILCPLLIGRGLDQSETRDFYVDAVPVSDWSRPGGLDQSETWDFQDRQTEKPLDNYIYRLDGGPILTHQFISGVMAALSAMVSLEIPQCNIMTKMDLLSKKAKKEIEKFLDPDMYSMIEDSTSKLRSKKFKKLTKAICELVNTSLDRRHTRRSSDDSGVTSDQKKVLIIPHDQRSPSRGLIVGRCHT